MAVILKSIAEAMSRELYTMSVQASTPYGAFKLCVRFVLTILTTSAISWFLFGRPKPFNPKNTQNKSMPVHILVLGDIGRSPRMQYHALSIAKHGGNVTLIGYYESALLPELARSNNVSVWALRPPPRVLTKVPFIIGGPLKVLHQVFHLFMTLVLIPTAAKWLIVQNPPSIPTLIVAAVVCPLRNTRLMIDWHNYGWTILAGTRGRRHPFVTIYKLYECLLGRFASSANLAVTAAMKAQLRKAPYKITTPIVAMHDRPAAIFQPFADEEERRTFLSSFLRGLKQTPQLADDIMNGGVRLLVSSTSWTPDEDFGILLDALVHYAAHSPRFPLVVFITGRGPQKTMYEAKIAQLRAAGRLRAIEIFTAFLSFENYAKLLAAADLGICLHKSSSGVDLPMKVVDMFGAGLPVLAYSKYPSFSELVKVGHNGRGFENSEQLLGGLLRLLDFSNGKLARLKEGAMQEGARRWDEEWDEVVKPLLGFA